MKARIIPLCVVSIGLLIGMKNACAAEKEIVLVEDKLLEPGRWKGVEQWKIINDKENGGKDAGSLIPIGCKQICVETKEFDPVNPSEDHCIVRASARLRIGSMKQEYPFFALRLVNSKGHFYCINILREGVLIDLCYANGENKVGKEPRWVKTRIISDQEYHTYTLEIHPDGKTVVLLDGNVMDERSFPDPNFTISAFQILFWDTGETHVDGEWAVDGAQLSKTPVK